MNAYFDHLLVLLMQINNVHVLFSYISVDSEIWKIGDLESMLRTVRDNILIYRYALTLPIINEVSRIFNCLYLWSWNKLKTNVNIKLQLFLKKIYMCIHIL